MVPVIAESNRIRQQQCIGTPFMTELLVDIFGYLADPALAQQVIDGTFIPPPGTNEYVVEFIVALKKTESIKKRNEISLIMTTAENKEGWKK